MFYLYSIFFFNKQGFTKGRPGKPGQASLFIFKRANGAGSEKLGKPILPGCCDVNCPNPVFSNFLELCPKFYHLKIFEKK